VQGDSIKIVARSTLVLPATSTRPSWHVHVFPCGGAEASFPEDHLLLTIDLADGQEVLRHAFESSYGGFELVFHDLTGDGLEELLLVAGEGRGTSVRTESLSILALQEDGVSSILEQRLSDYYALGCKWEYRLVPTQRDGRHGLELTLDVPGHEQCQGFEAHLPRDRMKRYSYDSVTGEMSPDPPSGPVAREQQRGTVSSPTVAPAPPPVSNEDRLEDPVPHV
jgi:hypothetical protein